MKIILYICTAFILLIGCRKNSKQFQFHGEQKKVDFTVVSKAQTTRLPLKSLPPVPTDLLDLPDNHPLFDIDMSHEMVRCYTDSLVIVGISYKLESSITIMNEGPHCDLTDWHHGYTNWENLTPASACLDLKERYFDFNFKIAPHQRDSLPFPIKICESFISFLSEIDAFKAF